jgi:non-specific serine/threonine protein kinase
LSQEALAERARISTEAIGALERGNRASPHRETLGLLIEALDLGTRDRLELEAAAVKSPLPRHTGGASSDEPQCRSNLPLQPSSFVGRADVVAAIKALLEQHRLVSLVGTGGVGKTRCAIQVGAEFLEGLDNGVCFAELAPISDPSLVPSIILRALGVQESPNRAMLDVLLGYLKRKRLLLILDNCEHVIQKARDVVAAIVHTCPNVRVLVTSRESLNIAGEHLYRMPSLSVPPAGRTLCAQDIVNFGATLLFSDRAFSVDNRFTLSDEHVVYVAEICRRLDGIPLALELAAARVKVLSPKQLAQKLDEHLRVLTGGDRSALPRHQTMRALIDWSYDLLTQEERAHFCKLSIFAGGFTVESASAVCGGDEIAMLDLLSSLVDKSLVQAEEVAGGMRYRLLESTRQYAREKLSESGEYEATAYAHATAFLALAEELERGYDTMTDRLWTVQVHPEIENWRAALEWTLTRRNSVEIGQRLVAAMRDVWLVFAAVEGRRWVRLALGTTIDVIPNVVVARLCLTEAVLDARLIQNALCYDAAQRALVHFRELDDPRGIAEAEQLTGRGLNLLGRITESQPLLRAAREAFRRLGLRKSACWTLEHLGFARHLAGDFVGARAYFAEGLAIAKATGSERVAAVIAATLAETEFHRGEALAALQPAHDAIDGFRSIGDETGVAHARCNLAAYLVALARYDEAHLQARDALALSRDFQFDVIVAISLQHLAAIAVLQPVDGGGPTCDARALAARLLGYVDGRLTALESPRQYTEQKEYDEVLLTLRGALRADELAELMEEGRAWNEDNAVTEAMLI